MYFRLIDVVDDGVNSSADIGRCSNFNGPISAVLVSVILDDYFFRCVGSAGRSKPPFQLTPGCRLILKFNNYCWLLAC